MKTIITSVKGPPLRRVLCSFLFGAAAFFVVPTNGQAPGDIVWVVTAGNSIAAYNANGTALKSFNLIPEQSWPAPGGIRVSGPNLYVPSDNWACCPNKAYLYALLHDEAYLDFFVVGNYPLARTRIDEWLTLRLLAQARSLLPWL